MKPGNSGLKFAPMLPSSKRKAFTLDVRIAQCRLTVGTSVLAPVTCRESDHQSKVPCVVAIRWRFLFVLEEGVAILRAIYPLVRGISRALTLVCVGWS